MKLFKKLFIIISVIFSVALILQRPFEVDAAENITFTFETHEVDKEYVELNVLHMPANQSHPKGVEIHHIEEAIASNYTFMGWKYIKDGTEHILKKYDKFEEDTTFYATWVVTLRLISYELDGGINHINNPYYFYGTEEVTLEEPAKEGYLFVGWYNNPDYEGLKIEKLDKHTISMTLYAKWSVGQYTVTFKDHDGEVLKTEVVDYLESATAPADPTRVGYTFTGWDKLFNSITEDLEVTALYEINTYNIEYYLYEAIPNDPIVFNPNNTTYTVEDSFVLEIPMDRISASFAGWYLNPEFSGDIVSSIVLGTTGDIELYAKWEINKYTVTFVVDGDMFAEIEVEHSNTVDVLPVANKVGYEFIGWRTSTDNEFTTSTVINENITVTALFIKLHNVMFVVDEDIIQQFEIRDMMKINQLDIPEDPFKELFIFTGWYLNGELFNFNNIINTNITLVAGFIDDEEALNFLRKKEAAESLVAGLQNEDLEAGKQAFEDNAEAFGVDLEVYESLTSEEQERGLELLKEALADYMDELDTYIEEATLEQMEEFAEFITLSISMYEDFLELEKAVAANDYASAREILDELLDFEGTTWHEKELANLIPALVASLQAEIESYEAKKEAAESLVAGLQNEDLEAGKQAFEDNAEAFGVDLEVYESLTSEEQERGLELLKEALADYMDELDTYIEEATLEQMEEFAEFITLSISMYEDFLELEKAVAANDYASAREILDELLDFEGTTWHEKELANLIPALVASLQAEIESYEAKKEAAESLVAGLQNEDLEAGKQAFEDNAEAFGVDLEVYESLTSEEQERGLELLKEALADYMDELDTYIEEATLEQMEEFAEFITLSISMYEDFLELEKAVAANDYASAREILDELLDFEGTTWHEKELANLIPALVASLQAEIESYEAKKEAAESLVAGLQNEDLEAGKQAFEYNAEAFGVDLEVYESLTSEEQERGLELLKEALADYMDELDTYIEEATLEQMEEFAEFITLSISMYEDFLELEKAVAANDYASAREILDELLDFEGTTWHEKELANLIPALVASLQAEIESYEAKKEAAESLVAGLQNEDLEAGKQAFEDNAEAFGVDLEVYESLTSEEQERGLELLKEALADYMDELDTYIEEATLEQMEEFAEFITLSISMYEDFLELEKAVAANDYASAREILDELLDFEGTTWHEKELANLIPALVASLQAEIESYEAKKEAAESLVAGLQNEDLEAGKQAFEDNAEAFGVDLEVYESLTSEEQERGLELLKEALADYMDELDTYIEEATLEQMEEFAEFITLSISMYEDFLELEKAVAANDYASAREILDELLDFEGTTWHEKELANLIPALVASLQAEIESYEAKKEAAESLVAGLQNEDLEAGKQAFEDNAEAFGVDLEVYESLTSEEQERGLELLKEALADYMDELDTYIEEATLEQMEEFAEFITLSISMYEDFLELEKAVAANDYASAREILDELLDFEGTTWHEKELANLIPALVASLQAEIESYEAKKEAAESLVAGLQNEDLEAGKQAFEDNAEAFGVDLEVYESLTSEEQERGLELLKEALADYMDELDTYIEEATLEQMEEFAEFITLSISMYEDFLELEKAVAANDYASARKILDELLDFEGTTWHEKELAKLLSNLISDYLNTLALVSNEEDFLRAINFDVFNEIQLMNNVTVLSEVEILNDNLTINLNNFSLIFGETEEYQEYIINGIFLDGDVVLDNTMGHFETQGFSGTNANLIILNVYINTAIVKGFWNLVEVIDTNGHTFIDATINNLKTHINTVIVIIEESSNIINEPEIEGVVYYNEIVNYEVKFNYLSGEVFTAVVPKNYIATYIDAPIIEGLTFLGWFTSPENGELFDFTTKINSNIDLYAIYEQSNFKVSYYNGENLIDSFIVLPGETIEVPLLPNVPSPLGYELNWSEDLEGLAIEKNYAINIVFQAIEYSILYIGVEDGTYPEQIMYTINDEIVLEKISRDGFEFIGWYDNEELDSYYYEKIEIGSIENKIFYARWAENSRVAFVSDEQTLRSANSNSNIRVIKLTNDIFITNFISLGANKILDGQGFSIGIDSSIEYNKFPHNYLIAVGNNDIIKNVTFNARTDTHGLRNGDTSSILHTVQVYTSINVLLEDLSTIGGTTGVLINGGSAYLRRVNTEGYNGGSIGIDRGSNIDHLHINLVVLERGFNKITASHTSIQTNLWKGAYIYVDSAASRGAGYSVTIMNEDWFHKETYGGRPAWVDKYSVQVFAREVGIDSTNAFRLVYEGNLFNVDEIKVNKAITHNVDLVFDRPLVINGWHYINRGNGLNKIYVNGVFFDGVEQAINTEVYTVYMESNYPLETTDIDSVEELIYESISNFKVKNLTIPKAPTSLSSEFYYKFVGWSVDKATLLDNEELLLNEQTYYALWEESNEIRITINLDGSTLTTNVPAEFVVQKISNTEYILYYGTTFGDLNLGNPTPPNNKDFDGWEINGTTANSQDLLQDGDIIKANISGSPYVYSVDSEGNLHLEHEPISFSIAKSLESTSFGTLRLLEDINGKYYIKVMEEGISHTMLNGLNLYAIDFIDDGEVIELMFDVFGNPHTIKELDLPINIITSLSSETNTTYIEVIFDRQSENEFAKFIFNAYEPSQIGSFWVKKLDQFNGAENLWWIDQIVLNNPEYKQSIQNIVNALSIKVQTWNGTEWITQGMVQPGARIDEKFLIELNLEGINSSELKVRLVMPTNGQYNISNIGIDFSENLPMHITELNLAAATFNSLDDVLAIVNDLNNNQYVELVDKQYVLFEFDAVSLEEGYIRSFGIGVKGYIYTHPEAKTTDELMEQMIGKTQEQIIQLILESEINIDINDIDLGLTFIEQIVYVGSLEEEYLLYYFLS